MRAAIVGCGIAGMAAALGLVRRGHEVTIFEAFDHPQPLGSGLLLQPSGLAALGELGLLEGALEAGSRIGRLDGRDPSGRRIMAMAYSDWRSDAFGLGIHRATLFQLLFQAVGQAGVSLQTGCAIVGWENDAQPILIGQTGERHGPYDLVVVADGSTSNLRRHLRPRARAPIYPWGAVWANAEDAGGQFSGVLHQRYRRASTMMGILPIGRGPEDEGPLVSFFWSIRLDQMDGFLAGDLGRWRENAAAIWPEAAPVLEQFTRAEQFSRASYRDVSIGRWSRGGLVLIGDAAHGTSPQLGQGGNLALVDAVELADHLSPTRPVAVCLLRYQSARRRHTAAYQLISRLLTPLFQSRGWLGPLVRDWFFTPLSQAPGLRQLAAQILTGTLRLGRFPRRESRPPL